MKKILENKTLGIIFKIIKILLTLAVVFVVSIILIQRIFNNNVSLFGYRIFTIVSGSMDPEYKILDVIVSRTKEISEIEVGDDLVYIGRTGTFEGKIVTHRVIKIEMEDNKKAFYTQGIANTGVDPVVYEDQIYGVVLHKSVILSFASKLVSHPLGFMLLILVPASILIATEMYDRLQKKE